MTPDVSAAQDARKRAADIFSLLQEHYGKNPWNWHTRQSPFWTLIGTLLSHRTKDEMTDRAAEALLSKYSTPAELANANIRDIEALIRPVNYYRTKAERVKKVAQRLLERFGGEVPSTIDKLLELPGVGRKTANCVLVYAFHRPAVPVDTHVHRISNRLELVRTETPEETEKALWEAVPAEFLIFVNELLVKHGQNVCRPQGPLCSVCVIWEQCPYGSKVLGVPKKQD